MQDEGARGQTLVTPVLFHLRSIDVACWSLKGAVKKDELLIWIFVIELMKSKYNTYYGRI